MSLASGISPASPITHATPALAQAAQPTEESSNNKTEARRSSDGRSNGSGWSEWFDTGDDGQPEIAKDNRRYSKSNTSAITIHSDLAHLTNRPAYVHKNSEPIRTMHQSRKALT
ncbi:hypothetical protein TrVFT333_006798 [Trichoderma virens FT-333]|nr:hypothetical protein TrVFT333_006798 [Trichoderma virens FT-333]